MRLLWLLLVAGCGGGSSYRFTPDDAAVTDAAVAPDLASPLSANVSVLVQPEAGVSPILEAIRGAKSTIDVETYLLTDDTIANALVAARKAGRQVRVILDRAPMGASNQGAYGRLSAGGVLVIYGRPEFTFTHAKFMILDGKSLWIMTMNFSNNAVSGNREYLIVDGDPADIAEAQRVFDADWTRGAATVERLVVAPLNAREKLYRIIDGATRTLDIEWESLSDDDLGAHVAKRVKAGVRVRIVAPTRIEGTPTQAMLQALRANGAEVRLLTNPYPHAKMVLADRARGYIGSVNGTTNSLDRNREMGTTWEQAQVAGTVGATFDKDFASAQPLF